MKQLAGEDLWKRYRKHLWNSAKLGLSLDISRMGFSSRLWAKMEPAMQQAFEAMDRLEAGAIANPDEQRMVGHYWLRAPQLAPNDTIRREIEETVDRITTFARAVHEKQIVPPLAQRYTDLLLVGIGGSALGPQLVAQALSAPAGRRDKMTPHFMDNTDPDGMHHTLEGIGNRLKSTMILIVSKSGTTPETHNGMVETQAAFAQRHLDFSKQAVAITGVGSQLDKQAKREHWLERFPMWDWIGGRTSVTSAVGLVPAALQGVNINAFLTGAAEMDRLTRVPHTRRNPAAKLALMWYDATGGKGEKDMVVLPYKDRLVLLSRYLQQLVMESLGKAEDLDGKVVHQGIAVYGNKGSTDQHAYVQQLRDGLNNFFANFIVVLEDEPRRSKTPPVTVGDHATSGDYLSGFWQGTRQALYENGRESVTITLDNLNPRGLGALIALYERTVGYYATLINVNAYHQPGVEAGKKAAAAVLDWQEKVVEYLRTHDDQPHTPEQVAQAMDAMDHVETIEHILAHLAANRRHVERKRNLYQAVG